MSSHLSTQELLSLRDRTIDPNRFLRADRHIAGCEYCQRKWRDTDAAPAIPAVALELEPPLHPSFEAISVFLDGRQDAASRERIEMHLASCRQCGKEVDGLRKFDARMEEESRRTVSAGQTQSGSSQREWVAALFEAPGRLRFVTASAALAIIGLLAMIKVQLSTTGLQTHLAFPVASTDSPQFYGGVVLAALGVAGILYRLRK